MAGESRSRQPFVISDFRAGLGTEEPAVMLPPGAAVEATNTVPSPSGGLGVRPTVRQLDTNSGTVPGRPSLVGKAVLRPDVSHSIRVESFDSGVDFANVAVQADGGNSQAFSWTRWNRLDTAALNTLSAAHGGNRSWVAGGRSLNFPLVPVAFCTLNGQTAFITNRSFGRIGVVATGDITAAPYIHRIIFPQEAGRDLTGCIAVTHHGRMFVAGNNSFPLKLRWSWVGPPCPEPDSPGAWSTKFDDVWPSTNFLNVDANGSTNDPISGLVSFGNVLWVLTTGAAYQISGADWDEGTDIVIQQVPGAAGCVSPRSVWSNDSGIFYMAEDGPKRIDRARFENISAQVARTFSGHHLADCHAWLTPDRYFVTLPSDDSVTEVRNALPAADSTGQFPSWQPFAIDPAVPPSLSVGTGVGAEGDSGNYLQVKVNSVTPDTGITPTDVTPFPSEPLPNRIRHLVIPFSTSVNVRFWVRRPVGKPAWDPDSGLHIGIGWLFENDYGPADEGIGFPVGSAVADVVVGGNAEGDWNLIDLTLGFTWSYPTQPPAAIGIHLGISFFGWAVGTYVDFDKFQIWPGGFDEPGGDVVELPDPTDPIVNSPVVEYDRTYVYDIPTQSWARWTLDTAASNNEPANYSRPQPHTQDRVNYMLMPDGQSTHTLTPAESWVEQVTTGTPAGWWRFDEDTGTTLADSSGNGYDVGIASGAPVLEWATNPDTGSTSIQTNGAAISRAYTAALTPVPITVAAWVWWDSTAQSAIAQVANTWTVGLDGTGQIYVTAFDGGTSATITTTTVPDADSWHFLVWVNDGTTGTIYLDGAEIGSGAQSYDPPAGGAFWVGRDSTGTFQHDGAIDDLLVYDRLLTTTEIAHLSSPGGEIVVDEEGTGGGYYTVENRRVAGDKRYAPPVDESGPFLEPVRTPWRWTSGAVIPATTPLHEVQIIDSHVNLSTVGNPNPALGQGPIEVSSRWNGTNPNPATISSVTPQHGATADFTTERIRAGYLGRGQWAQVHLEGDASGEVLIHAVDLETEVDARP